MSQLTALYQWSKEIDIRMPHLSRPQVKVLSAFSFGIASARHCTLNMVAEALPTLGKPDTVERRLQRFIASPKMDWLKCCRALSEWVIGSIRPDTPLMLLVDETSLNDRLKVMAVSLAYRGRAIPLAWWCYPQKNWPMGQVELIRKLLECVRSGMGEQCGRQVVVQADRGIGSSPDLLRAIENMGWGYLVRVQRQVRLRLSDGSVVRFGDLETGWRGEVEAFKRAKWVRCWAEVYWEEGHDDQWLVLTNCVDAQGRWYGMRMWEELAFRDFKSYGWEWQRSRVWNADHANILWLAMSVAYVWTLSMGTQVSGSDNLMRELTRGKKRRLSLFRLGLRLLRRWLYLGRELTYTLHLITDPLTQPKTVVY